MNLTMSEPAPAFDETDWGNIPLLTYLDYESWKETMTLLLEAMDAYEIITGEEPEPPPIDIDYHEWKIRAAEGKTTIRLSCSPAIQFFLEGLRSPGAMWTMLQAHLENSGTPVGRTTIQRKFRACSLQKDKHLENTVHYFVTTVSS